MPISPRNGIAGLSPCVHGSIGEDELRARGLGQVIDFSVSCNPLGPSPAVSQAIARTDPSRYPDDRSDVLRQALARRLGVTSSKIAVGNGSVELIWFLAEAYLRPGDEVLVVGPTFGEYARAASIHGATVTTFDAREADTFRLDLAKAARMIAEHEPRMAIVCSPNNPTGHLLRPAELARLADVCADGMLVIDEAYLSFASDAEETATLAGNGTVLLRSMTKDYGLAGLRLGYLVADETVTGALDRVRPPWNVNAFAQAAGVAALGDDGHLARTREAVTAAKRFLIAALTRLGLPPVPSAANFLLVKVGDGARFRAQLLAKGCCVRDCASFGLPAYVRIGIRTKPECETLVAAIREVHHES